MASTRHDGRNYQEEADSAAAIAAVAVATNADAEADTILAAGAVDGSDAEAMDAEIFDFAASINTDNEDVAEEVDEAGDGNVGVGHGTGDNNSNGDDQRFRSLFGRRREYGKI